MIFYQVFILKNVCVMWLKNLGSLFGFSLRNKINVSHWTDPQYKIVYISHFLLSNVFSSIRLSLVEIILISKLLRSDNKMAAQNRNCKSCVYNCDDHLLYNSSPRSSHIWFSYIRNLNLYYIKYFHSYPLQHIIHFFLNEWISFI